MKFETVIKCMIFNKNFLLLKNPDLSRKRKKSHDDGPPAKRSKSEAEEEVQQMLKLQANQY